MSTDERYITTKLREKQELFCRQYLVDLNATQAAIRSGYSPKTAGSQGFDLLKKPEVQARLTEMRIELVSSTEISPERVLRELGRIAFGDPRRVMTWGPGGVKLIASGTLSDDDAAIVSEVSETTTERGGSLRLKVHDKLSALEKIMRHLGMGTRTSLTESGSGGDGLVELEEFIQIHRKFTKKEEDQ